MNRLGLTALDGLTPYLGTVHPSAVAQVKNPIPHASGFITVASDASASTGVRLGGSLGSRLTEAQIIELQADTSLSFSPTTYAQYVALARAAARVLSVTDPTTTAAALDNTHLPATIKDYANLAAAKAMVSAKKVACQQVGLTPNPVTGNPPGDTEDGKRTEFVQALDRILGQTEAFDTPINNSDLARWTSEPSMDDNTAHAVIAASIQVLAHSRTTELTLDNLSKPPADKPKDGPVAVHGEVSGSYYSAPGDRSFPAMASLRLEHKVHPIFKYNVEAGVAYTRKNKGFEEYSLLLGDEKPSGTGILTVAEARFTLFDEDDGDKFGESSDVGNLTIHAGTRQDSGTEEYPWWAIGASGTVGPFTTDGKEFSIKGTLSAAYLIGRSYFDLSADEPSGADSYHGVSLSAGVAMSFLSKAITLSAGYAFLGQSLKSDVTADGSPAEGNIHQIDAKLAGNIKLTDEWKLAPEVKMANQWRYNDNQVLSVTGKVLAKYSIWSFGPVVSWKRVSADGALFHGGDAVAPVNCQDVQWWLCDPVDAVSTSSTAEALIIGGTAALEWAAGPVTVKASVDLGAAHRTRTLTEDSVDDSWGLRAGGNVGIEF